MKEKRGSNLYAGLMNIFAVILVAAIMAYGIADSYRITLDGYLGTQSSVTINDGDETDLYDYLSDYETAEELVAAHMDLNERLEEEGAVLLKNENNALPLSSDGNIKVTLFGMRSDLTQFSGSIGATTATAQNVKMADAFNARGFEVNPDMVAFYQGLEDTYTPGRASSSAVSTEAVGATVNEVPQSEYAAAPADTYASYADAAIIVLGRDSGESCDYFPGETGIANPDEFDEGSNILGLSRDEKALVQYVKDQGCFEKIIVLLNTTSTMEIESLKDDPEIDSIMWIGNPGCYGFYGIADLMNAASGVSPSGSLVDTYAVNTANSPAAQNFGVYMWNNAADIDSSSSYALRAAWYLVENEGIYDGYKYYETRYYDSIVNPASGATSSVGSSISGGWDYENEVSYPFGYGLSYTTFSEEIVPEKSEIQIDGTSTITVRVTNTGDVAGKDNVQLYLALPYADGQVEKSAIQLVGYAKTGEAAEGEGYENVVYLQPGESEEVTITVERDYYASYDEAEGDGAYVLDAGTYYFAVGDGAHDALQNVMTAQGYLSEGNTAAVVSADLAEKQIIDETKEGAAISNQFTDSDINSLIPDTTTYLSRSDWAGTFPETVESLTATEEMITQLRNDTYTMAEGEDTSEFKFGTLGHSDGTRACELKGITDYDDPTFAKVIANMPLETIAEQIAMEYSEMSSFTEMAAGNAACMDGPVGLLLTLGTSAKGIYAMDETDPNYNFSLNTFVSEPVVASTFSHKLAEEEGKLIGNDSIWTQTSWWFAPAMNLHRLPYNGRNNEYYSEDSVLTGYMASDTIIGAQSRGVVTTIKHFAFNNMETNREGVATFFDEQGARENELRGFQMAFEAGGSKAVMTSFNRVGCTFSSADEGLITGLLRGEWDFRGIVTTDMVKAPEYETWEESVLAGTDIMLNTSPVNEDGKTWETCQAKYISGDARMTETVYESVHHVLYAFADSVWLNGMSENTRVERLYPYWELIIISLIAVGAAGTAVSGGLWIFRSVKNKNRKKGA
ncbi:MAG TPA: glycoside hydrolase family 3 C-terminal domain-containing protein [Candidatus Mediterraneibacter cottocaccae]|nr:glycoside hydrolase family 3 C-terminal domain-containing protein [Candidatus Mediterraneibacter cottocaccae]